MFNSVEYKITIINCMRCPNVYSEPTPNTGCGIDYYCHKAGRIIKSYCETRKEFPQNNEIPDWCPLGEHNE